MSGRYIPHFPSTSFRGNIVRIPSVKSHQIPPNAKPAYNRGNGYYGTPGWRTPAPPPLNALPPNIAHQYIPLPPALSGNPRPPTVGNIPGKNVNIGFEQEIINKKDEIDFIRHKKKYPLNPPSPIISPAAKPNFKAAAGFPKNLDQIQWPNVLELADKYTKRM